MTTKLQRGMKRTAQPLWLRLLAIFCIGLIGIGSTAQVCHAHVDSFEAALLVGHASGAVHAVAGPVSKDVSNRTDSDSNSAVNCPLCIAMHSALPVADTLPEVAMLSLATIAPHAESVEREFSWRFEMASRPPPAERTRA